MHSSLESSRVRSGGGGGGGGGGGATVQIGVGSGGEAARCRAFGDGLVRSVALEPTTFYVDCRGAGGGGKLYIRMTGPSKTELVEVERGYAFQYTTKAPGKYELLLLFNEVHVPGSPFSIVVAENPNHKGPYSFPEKVTVNGAGLRGGRSGVACTFYVDMSDAGARTLSVEIQGPDEAPILESTTMGRLLSAIRHQCEEPTKFQCDSLTFT